MKIKDLRALSNDELIQKEKNIKKDIFDLNYQRKMGRVEKPAQFRSLKRDIAKILTIIREREIDNGRDSKKAK